MRFSHLRVHALLVLAGLSTLLLPLLPPSYEGLLTCMTCIALKYLLVWGGLWCLRLLREGIPRGLHMLLARAPLRREKADWENRAVTGPL